MPLRKTKKKRNKIKGGSNYRNGYGGSAINNIIRNSINNGLL